MPVIRYTTGIVDWTSQECRLDRLPRKQMTLFKVLLLCADVDRLYVNRKEGSRGLLSVADVVCLEKHSLSVYVDKSKEPIMAKVKDHLHINASCDTVNKSTIVSNHAELMEE